MRPSGAIRFAHMTIQRQNVKTMRAFDTLRVNKNIQQLAEFHESRNFTTKLVWKKRARSTQV